MNEHVKNVLPFLIGIISLGIGAATQPDTPVRQSPFYWVFAASFLFGIWNLWRWSRNTNDSEF